MQLTKQQARVLDLLLETVDAYLGIGQFKPKVLIDPNSQEPGLLDYGLIDRMGDFELVAKQALTIQLGLPRVIGKTTILRVLEAYILSNNPYAKVYTSGVRYKRQTYITLGSGHRVLLLDELDIPKKLYR